MVEFLTHKILQADEKKYKDSLSVFLSEKVKNKLKGEYLSYL